MVQGNASRKHEQETLHIGRSILDTGHGVDSSFPPPHTPPILLLLLLLLGPLAAQDGYHPSMDR